MACGTGVGVSLGLGVGATVVVGGGVVVGAAVFVGTGVAVDAGRIVAGGGAVGGGVVRSAAGCFVAVERGTVGAGLRPHAANASIIVSNNPTRSVFRKDRGFIAAPHLHDRMIVSQTAKRSVIPYLILVETLLPKSRGN
jgi:hypothetical protein